MRYILSIMLMLVASVVYCQEFDLSNYVPITDNIVIEVVDERSTIFDDITKPVNPVDAVDQSNDIDVKADDNLAEMKKVYEQYRVISEDIKRIVDSQKVVKMTYNSDLEGRLTKLEESNKYLVTKEDVTKIVQQEVKKYVDIAIKDQNGVTTTKKVEVEKPVTSSVSSAYQPANKSTYSGTLDLPKGSVITHINGVPVQQQYSNSRYVPRRTIWKMN